MDQMPADEPATQLEALPRQLLDALGVVVEDHLLQWAELDEEAQDRRAEWIAAGDQDGHQAPWLLRASVAATADRAARLALLTAEGLAPTTHELARRGALADVRSPLHAQLAQVARGLKATHTHALALQEPHTAAATFREHLQGMCHGILRVSGGLMQLEVHLQESHPA